MRHLSITILALAFGAGFVPLLAAEKTVDELIRQLGSDGFQEREQAGKDLLKVGTAALPGLRQAVRSRDPEVALRAKNCVAQIEKNQQIDTLLDQLRHDPDPKRRLTTLVALYREFKDKSGAQAILPALIESINDPDPEVRQSALRIVGDLRPRTKDAVPRMLEIMQDPKEHEGVRQFAALGLMQFCQDQEHGLSNLPELLPALIKALDDPNINLRTCAVQIMGYLGPKAKGAVPRLLEILRDPKEGDEARQSAGMSLGAIGGCEEQAIPILLEVVKSTSPVVRHGAIHGLTSLGQQHPEVVPVLLKAMNDPDKRVQWVAIGGLGILKKDAKICVPAMIQRLRSLKANPHPKDQMMVVLSSLSCFGDAAAEALPLIAEIAQGKEHDYCAFLALEKIGPVAIPTLITLYESSVAGRIHARCALTRMTGQYYPP